MQIRAAAWQRESRRQFPIRNLLPAAWLRAFPMSRSARGIEIIEHRGAIGVVHDRNPEKLQRELRCLATRLPHRLAAVIATGTPKGM